MIGCVYSCCTGRNVNLKCCVGFCCVDRIMKLIGMLQEMLNYKSLEKMPRALYGIHRLGPYYGKHLLRDSLWLKFGAVTVTT